MIVISLIALQLSNANRQERTFKYGRILGCKTSKGYWNEHTEGWVKPVHATMLSSDTMTKEQAEDWFKQCIDKPFVVFSLKINYYVGNYTACEEKI
ncbi:hypothetical protein FXW04_11990 [Staphylococcus pseudintermedius]|nr:hypothetical protein [Staphylococcus pseudintermedius]